MDGFYPLGLEGVVSLEETDNIAEICCTICLNQNTLVQIKWVNQCRLKILIWKQHVRVKYNTIVLFLALSAHLKLLYRWMPHSSHYLLRCFWFLKYIAWHELQWFLEEVLFVPHEPVHACSQAASICGSNPLLNIYHSDMLSCFNLMCLSI